jgi:hypothetical protein
MTSHARIWIALFFAGFVAGCKSEPGEKLVPVSGTATVNGQPVPAGNVTFYPDRGKGNETQHQPMGVIGAGGQYELSVPGGRKGAPPGWYKIVVYAVDNPQPGKPNRYFVDPIYTAVDTTPLRLEVSADAEPGRYDLQLKP